MSWSYRIECIVTTLLRDGLLFAEHANRSVSWCGAQGMHSVAWREADMLALPFADAAFDAVSSPEGLLAALCSTP